MRAGVIGLLECCRCLYPFVKSPTATFHDAGCPAHAMTLGFATAHAGASWDLVAREGVIGDAPSAEPELGAVPPAIGETIEVDRVTPIGGYFERGTVIGVKGGAIRVGFIDGPAVTVSTSDEGQTWRRA